MGDLIDPALDVLRADIHAAAQGLGVWLLLPVATVVLSLVFAGAFSRKR